MTHPFSDSVQMFRIPIASIFPAPTHFGTVHLALAATLIEPMPRSVVQPCMYRLLLFLLLVPPTTLPAQEPLYNPMSDHYYFGPPHFADAADSAAFMDFRNGLVVAGPVAGSPPESYRLAWRENQHGGTWSVGRGDGSPMTQAPDAQFTDHYGVNIPFRTGDGLFGWMVLHETPCAMICRGALYYVEERGRTGNAFPTAVSDH